MIVASLDGVSIAGIQVSTVGVIILAQVINGLLLPFLAICLVLCVNEFTIMPEPPGIIGNCCLHFCVFVTVFLAGHLLIDETRGLVGPDESCATTEQGRSVSWVSILL